MYWLVKEGSGEGSAPIASRVKSPQENVTPEDAPGRCQMSSMQCGIRWWVRVGDYKAGKVRKLR
jgi:hypothetical protein